MIEIRFALRVNENGKILYIEKLHWPLAAVWGEQPEFVGAERNELGLWLCNFLSTELEQYEQFLDRYNLSKKEKDDAFYIHRLLSEFLNANIHTQTIDNFIRIMIHNNLTIPELTYKINNEHIIEENYKCSSIRELGTVLIHQAFKNKITFNICKNCGKWFIPVSKSDEIYCLRPSSQYPGKNCRQAAKYRKTMDGRHSDETIRLRKNIRQMLDNRDESTEPFNDINAEWQKKLNATPATATKDQYIDWLKSNYKGNKGKTRKKEAQNGQH